VENEKKNQKEQGGKMEVASELNHEMRSDKMVSPSNNPKGPKEKKTLKT